MVAFRSKEMGICDCRTISLNAVPKAIITGKTQGMIKMGIHSKTKQIIGIHILASHSSDLIAEAMLLVKNKNTLEDVLTSLPVFPTCFPFII